MNWHRTYEKQPDIVGWYLVSMDGEDWMPGFWDGLCWRAGYMYGSVRFCEPEYWTEVKTPK